MFKLNLNDAVSGAFDLKRLAEYRLPIYQGVTTQSTEEDVIGMLKLNISMGSGMIQVEEQPPLSEVYSSSHNPGTVGETWSNHHESFARFIYKNNKNSNGNIIEFGSGHGILSECYMKKFGKDNQWLRIDPSTPDSHNPNIKTQREYVSGYDQPILSVDGGTIVHSHFLEHIDSPKTFFEHIRRYTPGTRHIFSIPRLQKQLENKYASVLSFEHLHLIDEAFVEYWINMSGFEIEDKMYFGTDHSVFYSTVKMERNHHLTLPVPNCYERNYSAFFEFMNHYYQTITWWNRYVNENQSSTRPVYIVGSAIATQFLVCNGLNTDKIEGVLDNDTTKHGKRLYGTNLQTFPMKTIENFSIDPIILLPPTAYAAEIEKQIHELRSGGIGITPSDATILK